MVKVKKVKKKVSSFTDSDVKVKSTRDRMKERKKSFEQKGKGGSFIFPKEGTIRCRVMSQGPDKEIGLEVIRFYMGKDRGSIISPATFDEPCPFMEKYKELKNSDDEEDNQLATKLVPSRRYIIGVTCYKDDKGTKVDEENVFKMMMIPSSVYQTITDLYLDEDDWGDMTDPVDGYDIKISRTGKGMTDTNYSVTACPRKKLDSKYIKEMDLSSMLQKTMKSYDELEDILNEYLGSSFEDSSDEDVPKKKKKKRLNGDI